MSENKVQTIDRTLDIIELLANAKEGLGVTVIGQAIGLHKSTVYRLLTALSERGYIEKDPKSSTYKIGLKFIEISLGEEYRSIARQLGKYYWLV